MSGNRVVNGNHQSLELTGNVGKLSLSGHFDEIQLPGMRITQSLSHGIIITTNLPETAPGKNGPTTAFTRTVALTRDRWIKTGIFSLTLGKEMELEPTGQILDHYAASKHAAQLAEVYDTARMPSLHEQGLILRAFKQRGNLGQVFDLTGKHPATVWLSCEHYKDSARHMPINSRLGGYASVPRSDLGLARCVR